jgi:protein-arginine kinase activator protein McsA
MLGSEFTQKLYQLSQEDPDAFADQVVSVMRSQPDYVFKDPHPREGKIKAMQKLLKRMEEREKYEDCAFIVGLIKRLEDGD